MVSFSAFVSALISNPLLFGITVLIVGTIIVNGATDASTAIATAIGTRSIGPGAAIAMGAVCNFVGLIVMTMLCTAVADTIGEMVNFNGQGGHALVALAAAMVAIIVWGVLAWRFGIPTSQTHSLIAGLTGAALAVQGGWAGINMDAWIKVIYGLVVSSVAGFAVGWLLAKLVPLLFGGVKRSSANHSFAALNVIAAAFLAIMHGAQDGQKWMSVAMLGIALAVGAGTPTGDYPMWIVVFCATVLALGSGIGGKKIIKSVAMDMVSFEKYQGFVASLAAALCLLFASLTGMPVSTTHTKTTAIMGTGAAKRLSSVKWSMAGNMVLAWIFTFPGCGLMGWAFAKLFLTLAG
ncbi:MAG: inorganic phosphate transporter [Coriobacteriales bacterium]|jgi:PiT family inorganic phosphate transporter